jgi:hypothetical protein
MELCSTSNTDKDHHPFDKIRPEKKNKNKKERPISWLLLSQIFMREGLFL